MSFNETPVEIQSRDYWFKIVEAGYPDECGYLAPPWAARNVEMER